MPLRAADKSCEFIGFATELAAGFLPVFRWFSTNCYRRRRQNRRLKNRLKIRSHPSLPNSRESM